MKGSNAVRHQVSRGPAKPRKCVSNMTIRFPSKQEKPWVIQLRPIEDSVIAEIPPPPSMRRDYRAVYIDLLDHILQDYEIVALSQTIDKRQWGEEVPDQEKYIGALSQRHSVQAMITASYGKVEPPGPTSCCFVVHVVGHPNRTLLEELLEFGMTALPHIMYGLRSMPESWPLEMLSWNAAFVDWFRLKATDTVLIKLIEQSGLLLWTADRNLSFGLSQASGMDRILPYIEDVAQRWGLRAVVEWMGKTIQL